MAILIDNNENWVFPTTRYQGSKRKLLPWIYENIKDIKFDSAIDLFGGTCSVSYLLKRMGKSVTYNDYLKFNYYKGKAIIENNGTTLTADDIKFLTMKSESSGNYKFVQNTFSGIYYLDSENKWIDSVIANINDLHLKYRDNELDYKKALAYYALFESCLVKRPFNLFHRKNLNLRTNDVPRNFGNKTTWEKPFDLCFNQFANEANQLVFANSKKNIAINVDALKVEENNFDLVYIDPPYFLGDKSDVECDYRRMYHFLEGLTHYDTWGNLIDYNSTNLHLRNNGNRWVEKNTLLQNFEKLISKFKNSTIVISYKSPGIPSEEEIMLILKNYKTKVQILKREYNYALNKSNGQAGENIELLIVGS
ncbi:MAG: DNA adenine methylase [Dehalococcoidales bacterium]